MLNSILIKLSQIYEHIKSNGILHIIKELFFVNRNIIIFERSLDNFHSTISSINIPEIECKNISKSNSSELATKFSTKSRYFKTLKNIKKGYESFVLIKNNIIIGDCWFATAWDAKKKLLHPDVNMLGVEAGKKDIYMFDMYVAPEERGAKSIDMLKYAYVTFKDRGMKRIITFVMENNTPAIWMVRILGFKELNKKRMHRFLSFRIVTS